jgi:outer membrane immunogenic protein
VERVDDRAALNVFGASFFDLPLCPIPNRACCLKATRGSDSVGFAAQIVVRAPGIIACGRGARLIPPIKQNAEDWDMNFKRIVTLVGVAVAATTAQTALAADLPARFPAAVPASYTPVTNWTGVYVGAGFGYGLFDVESTSAAGSVTTGGRGWLATVQLGYDAQFGNWVAGVFADYDWSGIKSRTNTFTGSSLKERSAWSAGGRLGYLVVPQFLTYFTAGYTEARFQGITGVCVVAGCLGAILPSQTFSGYFLGGGTEYALSWFGPGLTIKTEYRLAEYSRDTFAMPAPAGATVTMRPFVQTIRSELVYKFNWGR